MGNFPIHHLRSAWCWTSRSLSPCHCSVTEIGWWCAGNLPTFCVATFYRSHCTIKVLHLMSFCQLSYHFHIARSQFWARLSSYAAPFIQKFQSDLSALIKFQSRLVKYLLRLFKSIRNGCSHPDRRSVGSGPVPAWRGARGCSRYGTRLPWRMLSLPGCALQGHSQLLLLHVIGLNRFFFPEMWAHLNFQHSQCLLEDSFIDEI